MHVTDEAELENEGVRSACRVVGVDDGVVVAGRVPVIQRVPFAAQRPRQQLDYPHDCDDRFKQQPINKQVGRVRQVLFPNDVKVCATNTRRSPTQRVSESRPL